MYRNIHDACTCSDMKTPLDHMIDATDTLIVSYENNGYNGNGCYIPKYHLSDFFTFRYVHNAYARFVGGEYLVSTCMLYVIEVCYMDLICVTIHTICTTSISS